MCSQVLGQEAFRRTCSGGEAEDRKGTRSSPRTTLVQNLARASAKPSQADLDGRPTSSVVVAARRRHRAPAFAWLAVSIASTHRALSPSRARASAVHASLTTGSTATSSQSRVRYLKGRRFLRRRRCISVQVVPDEFQRDRARHEGLAVHVIDERVRRSTIIELDDLLAAQDVRLVDRRHEGREDSLWTTSRLNPLDLPISLCHTPEIVLAQEPGASDRSHHRALTLIRRTRALLLISPRQTVMHVDLYRQLHPAGVRSSVSAHRPIHHDRIVHAVSCPLCCPQVVLSYRQPGRGAAHRIGLTKLTKKSPRVTTRSDVSRISP